MNKQDIVRLIENKVAEARAQFPQYSNVVSPIVKFTNKKSRIAGTAWNSTQTIEFNTNYIEQEGFEETVIHELAHLVTNCVFPFAPQAHGRHFRYVCQILGGSGRTYHTYDTSGLKRTYTRTRLEAKCNCRTHYVTKQAASKLGQYHCKKCKSKLVLTGRTKKFS